MYDYIIQLFFKIEQLNYTCILHRRHSVGRGGRKIFYYKIKYGSTHRISKIVNITSYTMFIVFMLIVLSDYFNINCIYSLNFATVTSIMRKII